MISTISETGLKEESKRLPMLSKLKIKGSLSLTEGITRKFESQSPQDNRALANVVNNLAGTATHRESIPSVLSQIEGFTLYLKQWAKDDSLVDTEEERPIYEAEDTEDYIGQWRGALAVAILYPMLFSDSSDICTCEWRKYVFETTAGDEKHSFYGEEQENLFVDAVHDAIETSYTEKAWFVLGIKRNNIDFNPLMQYSEEIGVIPAANLNSIITETENDVHIGIPLGQIRWLKKHADTTNGRKIVFTDPIKYLSIEQMDLLANVLGHIEMEQPNLAKVKVPLKKYQEDILEYRTKEVERQNSNDDAYKTFVQALLLRDVLDIETSIVLNEYIYEGTLTDMDSKFHYESVKKNKDYYNVFIDGKHIGQLDRQRIIYLHIDDTFISSKEYKQIKEKVDGILQNDSINKMLIKKIKLLPGDLQNVAKKRLQIPDGVDITDNVIVKPVFHKGNDEKLDKLYESAMTSFFLIDVDAIGKEFSECIGLFSKSDTSLEKVGGDVVPNWNLGVHGGDVLPLLPLTKFGGAMLKKLSSYETNSYNLMSTWELNSETNDIIVKISFTAAGITYQMDYTYEEKHQINMSLQKAPAPTIGIFPNVKRFWKMYYVCTGYPDACETMRADVCNHRGEYYNDSGENQIDIRDYKKTTENIKYRWRITQTNFLPSFVTIKENGNDLGLLFCATKSNDDLTQRAILAMDFGTTSTVGAVSLDDDPDITPAHIIFDKGQEAVKWQLNDVDGKRNSVELFIPAGLCATIVGSNTGVGQRKKTGSFFSVFEKLVNNVNDNATLLDGHIYYLGENAYKKQAHMDSNLKFTTDRTKIMHIRMFLKQTLYMYFLYCLINGVNSLELRYALPLAMDNELKTTIKNMMVEIKEELSKETGIEISKLRLTSESKAVGFYFQYENDVILDKDESMVVIDIGGGTTDFAVCTVGDGAEHLTVNREYSSRLASRKMLGERLGMLSCKEKKAALKIPDTASDTNSLIKTMCDCNPEDDNFLLCFDQFLQLYPDEFSKIIEDHQGKVYNWLVFQISLLGWCGRILAEKSAYSSDESKIMKLMLAGNGSNYYANMDDETKVKIITAIAGDIAPKASNGGSAITASELINGRYKRIVEQSKEPKSEVAFGLVYMDSQSFSDEEGENDQYTQESTSGLWDEFYKFIQRFDQNFPGAVPRIKDISNNEHVNEYIKQTFNRLINNKEALCENLIKICTWLEI